MWVKARKRSCRRTWLTRALKELIGTTRRCTLILAGAGWKGKSPLNAVIIASAKYELDPSDPCKP